MLTSEVWSSPPLLTLIRTHAGGSHATSGKVITHTQSITSQTWRHVKFIKDLLGLLFLLLLSDVQRRLVRDCVCVHVSHVQMRALLYVGFLVRAVVATGRSDLVVMSLGWGSTWVSVCLEWGGPGTRKEAEVKEDSKYV